MLNCQHGLSRGAGETWVKVGQREAKRRKGDEKDCIETKTVYMLQSHECIYVKLSMLVKIILCILK